MEDVEDENCLLFPQLVWKDLRLVSVACCSCKGCYWLSKYNECVVEILQVSVLQLHALLKFYSHLYFAA